MLDWWFEWIGQILFWDDNKIKMMNLRVFFVYVKRRKEDKESGRVDSDRMLFGVN